MHTRTLGQGLRVSAIGYGCTGLPELPARAHPCGGHRAIRDAAGRSVTFFDTAGVYGPFASEEIVGEALASVRDQAAGGFHRTSRDGRIFVEPAGLRGQALLEWVDAAAAFARTLPTKPAARERR